MHHVGAGELVAFGNQVDRRCLRRACCVTLVIFIVVILAFLIAPLVALGVGLPRATPCCARAAKQARRRADAPAEPRRPGVAHGFGAGAP